MTDKTADANVILDFAAKTVVKCQIEGKDHATSFDQLVLYYQRIYPALIEQLTLEAEIVAAKKKTGLKTTKKS